jgi:hypothetical protein
MAGTTALQLYSYPTTSDQASPVGIQTLAQSVERQVVAVFPDPATRDSRWAAAGGLANGALCFVVSTGELQLRAGGVWLVIGGHASAFAMSSGTVAYDLNNVSNVNVARTFSPSRFSLPPVVAAFPESAGGGSQALTFRCYNITATGFTINVAHVSLTVVTVTGESLGWVAIQMTSTAAGG